jgi:inorganic pyrophosphatase
MTSCWKISFSCLLLLISACHPVAKKNNMEGMDYSKLPLLSPNNKVQAIIENPAGSTVLHFYNQPGNSFETIEEEDETVRLSFLPHPVNFGFIAGTYTDSTGGLEVLVLCEAQKIGAVVEVIPLGLMRMLSDGRAVEKIIAVPAKTELNTLEAYRFADLSASVLYLLREWNLNAYPEMELVFKNFGDEREAMVEIEKWKVK